MSDDVGFVCPHCTTKIKYTAGMTFGEVMSLRHDKEHLSHKITRLRAENEKLREALKPLAAITLWTDKYPDGPLSVGDNQRYIDPQWIVRARAALEGVTKKEGTGNE